MALVAKSLPANAGDFGDTGSIPGSGISPGGPNFFFFFFLLLVLLFVILQIACLAFISCSVNIRRTG